MSDVEDPGAPGEPEIEPVIVEHLTAPGALPADAKEGSLAREEHIQTPLRPRVKEATLVTTYEERLRQILRLSYRGEGREQVRIDAEQSEQWDVLRSAVGQIVNPATLLSDQVIEAARAASSGAPAGEPLTLEGDPDTVGLLVAAAVERLTDPDELESFIRGSLASTIARLEEEGDATREQCVDIVVRVLRSLIGSLGAARLAASLVGYLVPQEERQRGYYYSVGNLASITIAPDEADAELRGAFIFHHAVDGIRRLVEAELGAEQADPGERAEGFDEATGRLVVVALSNIATIAGKVFRRVNREPGDTGRSILQDLARIAAVAAPGLSVAEDRGAAILASLRLDLSPPVEALTVLQVVGGSPMAWGGRRPALARLEASSAVAVAVGPDTESVPPRLFNAGVSLAVGADSAAHGATVAQLVLNALGLRWALLIAQGDPAEALVSRDGLDCAVNLMAVAVRRRDAIQAGEWPGVAELADLLGRLAKWPPLQLEAPGITVARARLLEGGKRLGVSEAPFEPGALAPAVEAAIEGLLPGRLSPWADDPALDTADAVGLVFTSEEMLPMPDWELLPELERFVAARATSPQATFVHDYSPFADLGPLVAAGAVEPAEWAAVRRELLSPIDSIAPLLGASRCADPGASQEPPPRCATMGRWAGYW